MSRTTLRGPARETQEQEVSISSKCTISVIYRTTTEEYIQVSNVSITNTIEECSLLLNKMNANIKILSHENKAYISCNTIYTPQEHSYLNCKNKISLNRYN